MDHGLARRLMVAYGRYKNSIYAVRNPFIYPLEMKLDDKEAAGLSDREMRQRGIFKAYGDRWERVEAERVSLDALLLEADAIWGGRLAGLHKRVEELVAELSGYINLYLREVQNSDSDIGREYAQIRMGKRDILYDVSNRQDDFRQDFDNAMVPIHAFLRTNIGRRAG